MGTIRVAWLLALSKVIVAAFLSFWCWSFAQRSVTRAAPMRRSRSRWAWRVHQHGMPDRGVQSRRNGGAAASCQRGVALIGAAILLIIDTDPALNGKAKLQTPLFRITAICRAALIPERRWLLP
jgi:hypothetical protein